MIGLGQLASSSELVVLQSVGRSRFNIVMAVLKTVLPVMVLIMLVGEYLAPITERRADDLKTMAVSGGQMTVSTAGVWIREKTGFHQHCQRAARWFPAGGDPLPLWRRAELLTTEQAKRGRYQDGSWVMEGGASHHLQSCAKDWHGSRGSGALADAPDA